MALRRWIIPVIVCLAVGVVVNVAVAWGMTLVHQSRLAAPKVSRFGACSSWPVPVPSSWPNVPAFATELVHHDLGRSVEQAVEANSKDGTLLVVTVHRTGWPCDSLRRASWSEMGAVGSLLGKGDLWTKSVWQRGLSVDWAVAGWHVRGKTLLLFPVWPGFAVNTLAYGAMAWGLLFAPGVVRRWRSRKRGACVKCGYDLKGVAAGSVCPECGQERTELR